MKQGIYAKYVKRLIDFLLSFVALVILSPLLLVLIVCGAIAMQGNPFFVQPRPGKNEKIFHLIKFRSMSLAKDSQGKLLPDSKRLNRYGRFIRSTSLDELPELINILKGDMSLIGPRPLSAVYLPYYNEMERHRHDVRPGLSGLAQVNGRNVTTWEKRFEWDIYYVDHISLMMDIKVILTTVRKVFARSDIGERQETDNGVGLIDFEVYRQRQWDEAKAKRNA